MIASSEPGSSVVPFVADLQQEVESLLDSARESENERPCWDGFDSKAEETEV